jgi:hypothetical protein
MPDRRRPARKQYPAKGGIYVRENGYRRVPVEAEFRECAKIYENDLTPQLVKEPGYAGSQLLVEEGGRMVSRLRRGQRERTACVSTRHEITVSSLLELNIFSLGVSL